MSRRFKVLVVDDDEIVRHLVAELLAAKGHECETAADGRAALARVEGNGFDAVVADIVMPELDGIGLTRELLRICPALPVMLMTGFRGEFTAQEALQAGARKFVLKPFSMSEFFHEFELMMEQVLGAAESDGP